MEGRDNELPAALVDNAVVTVTHPHHCKDLMARLCPQLSSLPEVRVHIPAARHDQSGDDVGGCNENNEISKIVPSENYTEENNSVPHEELNLFLDSGSESGEHPMSWERVFVLFRQEGWTGAVNVLKDRYAPSTWCVFLLDLLLCLSACLQCVAAWLLWWTSLERKNLLESLAIRNLYQRKNWINLNIKFLKWHPTMIGSGRHALALVTSDDIACVYFSGRNDPTVLNGLNEGGNRVYCMDWKPFGLTLILGCRDGIHIFTLNPKSRYPSSHNILASPDLSCVTDLSVSPQCLHIATVSILSSTIVVWDLTDFRAVKLFKYFSAPSYLVRWSPSGLHVAVGTTGLSFKFYSLLDSSCNKWSLPRGYVTCLVWTPDDRYVLFASSEDSCVHFIQYASVTGIADKRATPLIDTSTMILDAFKRNENVRKNHSFQKKEDTQKRNTQRNHYRRKNEDNHGNKSNQRNHDCQKNEDIHGNNKQRNHERLHEDVPGNDDNQGCINVHGNDVEHNEEFKRDYHSENIQGSVDEEDMGDDIIHGSNRVQRNRNGLLNDIPNANLIQSLALDSKGQYLAVSFRHAPVIGLYKLDIGVNIEVWAQHRLPILPAFGSLASMDFLASSDSPGNATVLTLAWNNGVLQHFPII